MPNSSLPESLKKTVECANMEETQYVWNVAFRGEEEMWRGQTLGWQHLSLSRAAQTAPSLHSPSHIGTPLGERVMSNRVKKKPLVLKKNKLSFEWRSVCGETALVGCGVQCCPGSCQTCRSLSPHAHVGKPSLNANLSCVLGQRWCSKTLFDCLFKNSDPKILA